MWTATSVIGGRLVPSMSRAARNTWVTILRLHPRALVHGERFVGEVKNTVKLAAHRGGCPDGEAPDARRILANLLLRELQEVVPFRIVEDPHGLIHQSVDVFVAIAVKIDA